MPSLSVAQLELLLLALKKDSNLQSATPPGLRTGFYQGTIRDFQEHGLIGSGEHVGFSGRRYPLTQFGLDVAVAYRDLTKLVQVQS